MNSLKQGLHLYGFLQCRSGWRDPRFGTCSYKLLRHIWVASLPITDRKTFPSLVHSDCLLLIRYYHGVIFVCWLEAFSWWFLPILTGTAFCVCIPCSELKVGTVQTASVWWQVSLTSRLFHRSREPSFRSTLSLGADKNGLRQKEMEGKAGGARKEEKEQRSHVSKERNVWDRTTGVGERMGNRGLCSDGRNSWRWEESLWLQCCERDGR